MQEQSSGVCVSNGGHEQARYKKSSRPGRNPNVTLDLVALLAQVTHGDHQAFETVYGELAGPVYGVVRQVLRDPAQSEEVAQEVLLEIWRTASPPLQRESIKLAYYSGYTYPQVAQLLGVALGTVKTRIRDGLIRMRDCVEVTW